MRQSGECVFVAGGVDQAERLPMNAIPSIETLIDKRLSDLTFVARSGETRALRVRASTTSSGSTLPLHPWSTSTRMRSGTQRQASR